MNKDRQNKIAKALVVASMLTSFSAMAANNTTHNGGPKPNQPTRPLTTSVMQITHIEQEAKYS